MHIDSVTIKKLVFSAAIILCFFDLQGQQNNIIPPPLHIKTIEFKPLDPEAYAPIVNWEKNYGLVLMTSMPNKESIPIRSSTAITTGKYQIYPPPNI